MFWRIIDINEEFAPRVSLTKNKRKSGVDKEEESFVIVVVVVVRFLILLL